MQLSSILATFWLLKSLVLTALVEWPMCKYGPDWPSHRDENPLLALAYRETLGKDRLVHAQPPHLVMQTCAHVYFFAPVYLAILVGLLVRMPRLVQAAGGIVGPVIFYASLVYICDSIYGSHPGDAFTVLAQNIDYPVFGLWAWYASTGREMMAGGKAKDD
jgi:hypothetical protein